MRSSFTLLRVRGIPIGAHWSWLFVFALVVWSLTSFLFPRTYPNLEDTTYLVMGVVAGVLFFVSILLHELGHAFRALHEGMEIDGITLWLFGGVARFKGMFPSARAEFGIAIAGPVVTLVIAALFGLPALAGSQLAWPDPLQGILDYLARINLLVLGFNLVPALPLDGGRVLRAWLWHRQESFAAATSSAARAGKIFAGVLAAVGLLDFFTGGGGAGGLWFVFLGLFLYQAAQSEASTVLVHEILGGRQVREFMTEQPAVVSSELSITEFLDEVHGRGHSTYPVVDDDRLVGLVSLRHAGAVPAEERTQRTVADVMMARDDLALLTPATDMVDALEALQEGPRRAPVMDNGDLTGIISISDVTRALRVEEARGSATPKARRAGWLVWAIVTIIIVAAGGFLYRPPLVVIEPGPTLDVSKDISISGISTDDIEGEYLLTSVQLEQPNALGLFVDWAFSEREIVALSSIVPSGDQRDEFFRQQREIFRQSRVLAAAAAAQAADLQVDITGTGAVVEGVLRGSPAEDELQSGDVIVAVNGSAVDLATDLQNAIGSQPPGTSFRLTVERDGSRSQMEITSRRLSGAAEGVVGIGVSISTRAFDVELPFEISFEERSIGGPSAGLAYALAITDLLEDEDLAAGRTIAATGTIDLDGEVGPIGGVDAKAVSVEEARADIFFVPQRDLDSVAQEGIEIRAVDDLEEALSILRST